MGDLRYRFYNRLTDLVCDAAVVALLLVATGVGVLPHEMDIAVIGFALRALVHPSFSLGIFNRTWPPDPPTITAEVNPPVTLHATPNGK